MNQRQIKLRYFTFPKYWDEISEPVQSAEWLFDRLNTIEKSYNNTEGEHVSVFIDDTDGNSINIGLVGDAWTITHISKLGKYESEFQYAIGNKSARGQVAILTPEWTETSRKQLIKLPTAQRLVKLWIETRSLGSDVQWVYDMP